MRPRCGKKLRTYRLNRPRRYDFGDAPVCGLPEGHESYSNCQSEESVKRASARKVRKRGTPAQETAKRMERKRRARMKKTPQEPEGEAPGVFLPFS
jgi:hypothetical protein